MPGLIQRDLQVEDIWDRIESLERDMRILHEGVSLPPVLDPEDPIESGISGWASDGLRLHDLTWSILLDPTIPMIQIATGGYIQSSDFVADTSGFQINGGTAEFNDVVVRGTIYADAGELGDLEVTGVLQVGSGSPYVEIDGGNKWIGTDTFVSGSTGWRIESDGSAEFNNITARGEIHTAVFVADLISAHAGTLYIAKSAGKLHEPATLSGSTYWIYITRAPGGGWLFDTGDIVRIKNVDVDTWATVTQGSQQTYYETYQATYQSGTSSGIVPPGEAVVDYGASGQGYLVATADLSNAPYYDVRTHAGAPWTTTTLKMRLGNLTGVTDADLSPSGYGLYTDNAFLKGSLIAGGGDVIANASGLQIIEGTSNTNYLMWVDDIDGDWVSGMYARIITGSPDYTKLYIRSPGEIDGAYSYGQISIETYTGANGLYLTLDPTNSLVAISSDVGAASLDVEDILTAAQAGIGAYNANYQLYVYQDADSYAAAIRQDNASGDGLYIQHDGTSASEIALRINTGGGSYPDVIRVIGTGRIGINDSSPDATLDIVQPGSSAAIPVLQLDQVDVDEPFIYFENGTLYTSKTEADEYVKVKWHGTTRWLRLYS